MKKSITVFIMMAVFIIAGLVIGYIYLPNADANNGSRSISELEMELPFKQIDLRSLNGSVKPYCNGMISFELKEGASIYAVTDAYVKEVKKNIITLEPKSGIEIKYSPINVTNMLEGTYILEGDTLGTLENGEYFLDFSVKNTNDGIFECPYWYFTEDSVKILDNKFDIDLCSCNSI